MLYFLQHIYDETHRFAITSHRVRRSKAVSLSLLDKISGISKKHKKAILFRFSSVKAIAEAGIIDLQEIREY